MTGTDAALIDSFPGPGGFAKHELIVHRSQRNGYDYAARMTGVTMVEVDATEDAVRDAISERTAGILWFAGAHWAEGALQCMERRIVHTLDTPRIVLTRPAELLNQLVARPAVDGVRGEHQRSAVCVLHPHSIAFIGMRR